MQVHRLLVERQEKSNYRLWMHAGAAEITQLVDNWISMYSPFQHAHRSLQKE
jgi:hypothetical protein